MNQHIKHIIVIALLLASNIGQAQSFTLKGKVIDMDHNPIDGAAIVIYDTSKTIITYTVSNEIGIFNVEATLKIGYYIEVTHIAFLKQQYFITNENLNNNTITIDFILEENAAALDEVILISSNKVKDTVRLDLDKLNLYEDDNLKDILKKIPNFRLSNDGTIIYKGKNIDKILVNNKPSFENQNSIALESIEKEIIDGISVINNYNDDFSIDFEENEESVLNIDTKQKNQKIVKTTLEAGYGYQDKYEFKGKAFLFSPSLNAFLTNHTNNIGQTTITSKEIRKLFSDKQPLSIYQGKSLNRLFATNENLKKDFFTSTNLTLRNQTQRLKTSGLFYHIAPNRISSMLQNTSTVDGTPLLNTTNQAEAKTQSFLGALSVAYKISDNTIGGYTVHVNHIDDSNISNVDNQLFNNNMVDNTNTILSNNKQDVVSAFHQLSLTSKLQSQLILETGANYYHEKTNVLNDYNVMQHTTSIFDLQDYKFDKNELQGHAGLKYKYSNAFIPFLSVDYKHTEEKISDRQANTILKDRTISNYRCNLEVNGKEIFKKLNYKFSAGVNQYNAKLDMGTVTKNTFIPIATWVEYENRLNRYYINYSRSGRFNELESGLNTIQAFNTIWIGDTTFPLGFNTSNTISASYNYNNLFDAKLFSISVSYSNQNNVLKQGFSNLQNGISEYGLFIADKVQNYKIASFYSKTIMPLKYPTKIDVSAAYTQTKYPTQITAQQFDVTTKNIAPELRIETITDHFINFSLSSKLNVITDQVQQNKYKSTYTSSAFSILMKNEKWKGDISFLYDNNRINNITYSRNNINLKLSHETDKITYSVEARHLGELLSVFENDAYNSQFIISNGIASTIVNNESLNYIIFGIKFKL